MGKERGLLFIFYFENPFDRLNLLRREALSVCNISSTGLGERKQEGRGSGKERKEGGGEATEIRKTRCVSIFLVVPLLYKLPDGKNKYLSFLLSFSTPTLPPKKKKKKFKHAHPSSKKKNSKMTRFTTSFLLLSVLALSKASLLVRAEEVSQVVSSSVTCVIHTPQQNIRVDHDFEITWANCKGQDKIIEVRSGKADSLDKKDNYACKVKDMEKEKSCFWTPDEEGHVSLSVVDDSKIETFTAQFVVESGHGKAKRAIEDKHASEKGKGKGEGKGEEKGQGKVDGKGKEEGRNGAEEKAKKGHPEVGKKPEYAPMPRRRSLPHRFAEFKEKKDKKDKKDKKEKKGKKDKKEQKKIHDRV